eukprot:CAMPEP_0177733994 /NCGR_PEP_ID=MMETSP0484_2-20121128/23987_1 /TAXON_ID=354590 /ORGANISM="Rhodomonas lens, Strain RHODO" /LENGTH=243 /DNA_ID=CAMNT_0019247423 /DNA_START=6 /DNA_END=734 /DNA_ORIENTATION=-
MTTLADSFFAVEFHMLGKSKRRKHEVVEHTMKLVKGCEELKELVDIFVREADSLAQRRNKSSEHDTIAKIAILSEDVTRNRRWMTKHQASFSQCAVNPPPAVDAPAGNFDSIDSLGVCKAAKKKRSDSPSTEDFACDEDGAATRHVPDFSDSLNVEMRTSSSHSFSSSEKKLKPAHGGSADLSNGNDKPPPRTASESWQQRCVLQDSRAWSVEDASKAGGNMPAPCRRLSSMVGSALVLTLPL